MIMQFIFDKTDVLDMWICWFDFNFVGNKNIFLFRKPLSNVELQMGTKSFGQNMLQFQIH